MYKICIFAGTTEGRKLIEFLSGQAVSVTACVATEYGETLITPAQNLTVSAKRLSQEEIASLFARECFDLVIDATHPYAVVVTEQVKRACRQMGTPYLRLNREASERNEGEISLPDIDAAVEFLNRTEGNILLTTGSKEISKYNGIVGFQERVYARVLPSVDSLEYCLSAGVKPAHIIAMQGPFSEECNLALLHSISAKFMVTKDGGDVGGFAAKAAAAHKAGAQLVIIGRPEQTEGKSLPEVMHKLIEDYGVTARPVVSIVGIGPGSRALLTEEAQRAIRSADCVIGAARMLQSTAHDGQARFEAIDPLRIADYITGHPEYSHIAVVMSGDTGFYSGTKKLIPMLEACDVRVISGISSLAYMCARLKTCYEDVEFVSLHGREGDIAAEVRRNPRIFVLVGGEDGVVKLCRTLSEAGLGDVRISVGERLSYDDEQITTGTAAELAGKTFDTLSSVLIENDAVKGEIVTYGWADDAFQRSTGDAVVPMTKSEVRSICLSKLQLTQNAVCWDVGAGTGSVSVEMARVSWKGQVRAIERREDAVQLIEANKARFGICNMKVVHGTAPEACYDLSAPTHVFIGGSAGNLREIVLCALEKNPNVRIVAAAITLESVGEIMGIISDLDFEVSDIVSVTVAKGKAAGKYHLMMGQNPVYIITMQYARGN